MSFHAALIPAFVFFFLVVQQASAQVPSESVILSGRQEPAPLPEKKQALVPAGLAEQVAWPRPIPCRTDGAASGEILITTLGEVTTPLAEGTYDPVGDRVTLKNGTVLESYFKETLGVKYYEPLDKGRFPLPPSGWCSWYFYYQDLSGTDVKRNAFWMGENLLAWGGTVCQIDDAWQGKGRGLGDNRDWTTVNDRFEPGMDDLADYIRRCGLTPGLWLAPHGQSNSDVVKKSGVFMTGEKGESLSKTWEGDFLLDPTKPGAGDFFFDLFDTLHREWGYDYFKIDGQPIVVGEYRGKKDLLADPPDDPDELYRETLRTIRRAIGEDSFLLGCWGMPLEGVGLFNGCRTSGDVIQGWDGFFVALDAVVKRNYLHNIAWYCDPDVFYVRPPLTVAMARSWATIQGLTGQATLTSDALFNLPAERVTILRSVMPAADIRPLDLFPAGREKTVWDLKVNHLGRAYDVVGCFNWDDGEARRVHLSWEELGLAADGLYHVYDFWNREYLGCWEYGYFASVPPAGVRVFTLLPAADHAQLISTSRHITQGWVDLVTYEEAPGENRISGRSRVPGDEPYVLTFAMPRTDPTLALVRFTATVPEGSKVRELKRIVDQGEGFATVTFWLEGDGEIEWTAVFAPADRYTAPVPAPGAPAVTVGAFDGTIDISWGSPYTMQAGYSVTVNGERFGYAPLSPVSCRLRDLSKLGEEEVVVEIHGVGLDGKLSDRAGTARVTPVFPAEVWLSDIEPLRAIQDWMTPGRDRSVEGEPLRIGKKTYEKGIGTHANATLVYNLRGKYARFEAEAGPHVLGREAPEHLMELVVLGDGKVLFESGIMKAKAGPVPVSVDVTGVRELSLVVKDGGDGIHYDHADWGDARIVR